MTQEISMTVEKQFKTLSNGLLTSSHANPDGTRTDTWKLSEPHAPYLATMVVGDFAVVSDSWHGKPVDYYVEPKYVGTARAVFGNTPQMLDFFSKKLGVEYPWEKYAQVAVRDYVSGAMENTTASTFGSFVQASKRELLDANFQTSEFVVAHELFHHWFGDYVTCESWSNLPLNESFADYSEYLWAEHKYGADEAGLVQESKSIITSKKPKASVSPSSATATPTARTCLTAIRTTRAAACSICSANTWAMTPSSPPSTATSPRTSFPLSKSPSCASPSKKLPAKT